MQYSQFLKWALSHLDVVVVLFTLVQTLVTAGTLAEKANALKAIIDTLLPVVSDFPSVSVLATESESELESQVCAALAALPSAQSAGTSAFDGKTLKAIFDIVGPLIPILLSLLK